MEIKKQEVVGYQFFQHRVKGEGFFISCFQKKGDPTSNIESSFRKENKKAFWTLVSKKQEEIIAPWLANPEDYDIFQDSKKGN